MMTLRGQFFTTM